jgi:hypothetical protein
MKFKVLMIGQTFVNEKMLSKGIYATTTPSLHNEDFTEKDLIALWENYSAFSGDPVYDAITNIKKCILVTIEIKILN